MHKLKNQLKERFGFYQEKIKTIGKDGTETTTEKRVLEIESFLPIACFLLCIVTFIAYLITKDPVIMDVVKVTFGAFLGSIPGSIRSKRKG